MVINNILFSYDELNYNLQYHMAEIAFERSLSDPKINDRIGISIYNFIVIFNFIQKLYKKAEVETLYGNDPIESRHFIKLGRFFEVR